MPKGLDPEVKKNGSISQGGATQVRGERIIEAKNLDEAFDLAWDAQQRGEKYKIVRKK